MENSETHLHEKTSILLRRIVKELDTAQTQVGFLLYRLRRRSFGGLLFFLAILCLIPGVSMFAAVVVMALGGQLLLGSKSPKLPRIIGEYKIDVGVLTKLLSKTARHLERFEQHIKPRYLFLSSPPATFLIGAIVCLQALLIFIPLPFTNLLPALATFILALGLLERDGVLILCGVLLSTFACWLSVIVIRAALQGLGL